jgi:hypothetical protein
MKKLIWVSVLVGFALIRQATPALAISVALAPSSATVAAGGTLSVAVVISGLVAGGPPSVGAFDLTVSFDPAILSLAPTGVTFGLSLGDPALFEALPDVRVLPGFVEFAEVSLLSPTDLDKLQLATFTLATLSFSALAPGTTTLSFSGITVDDAFGNKLPVVPALPAPEPSSLLLLGFGLAAVGATAWRSRRGGT